MSLQTWLNGLIKSAVDAALLDVTDELKAFIATEIQVMEQNLTAQITSLPGLIGSQIANVAVDAGQVASNVVAAVNGQLAGFPQQIINGVLQGIPHILNPFKDAQ